jgi:hypothetical protein
MNKFSDFADTSVSPIMDGRKIALDEILGKEINVLKYRIKNTKYADAKNPQCLTVQFVFPETPDEHRVFFSGSSVLMRQLEDYKDKLPFTSIIKRVGKYFTFS